MNSTTHSQVFQTNSASRWKKFKWTSRFFILLFVAAIVAIIIAYLQTFTPAIPLLKDKNASYKKVLDPANNIIYKNSLLARKYGGFRKYITDKEAHINNNLRFYQQKKMADFAAPQPIDTASPLPIRSAFYVPWDPQSFYSLQRNIQHLNMVIPEWMFIDPNTDTLYTNVDDRALEVMKKAGVSILPILSNNYKEIFRGDAVHRILHNPAKKERLIQDVINVLEKNKLAGVNVDFEELSEKSDAPLIAFQKELYERLHAKGFLVTQDMIPFNEDYNYKALAKYNDYLFVMAYDQFSQSTAPGPISEQKWIEGAVEEAARNIPAQKLVLGMGAYGYDWPKNGEAASLTYQQALTTAKESEGHIVFNNDSYNLHYSYDDENDRPHDVYFTDAASTFNTMRFATEYGLGGVALWRLGSEDARVWSFYQKDLRKELMSLFDADALSKVKSTDDVDYTGDGEILDVRAIPTAGHISTELDSTDYLISEERYDTLPSMFVVKKYGKQDPKKLVLTFDDGPDPVYTSKILNILSQKNVPATFFLVGINAENNIPLVKRIYREGHEIGNHTFTHPNIATVSHRRSIIEMESTRLLLECITGHSTILFRAPYNADSEPEKYEELLPIAIARTKNYLDVGESIDPEDWQPGVTADTIVSRIIKRKEELTKADQGGNIILLHDAGGNSRQATVDALPKIIDYYRSQGYTFTTIADLLGKRKADLMPAVPRGSGFYLLQLNYGLAEFGYWTGHIMMVLFILFIILSMVRILLMAWLAWQQHRREKNTVLAPLASGEPPLVSIIVPAYNEEVNIVNSLQNLLKTDYPNAEIIFVDDGSRDDTYKNVCNIFSGQPCMHLYTKPNGGKASALNFGIAKSAADFVVCIDADTQLKPDAVSKLMRHFVSDDIGAVAGNVKVGNEINMLTKWQAIEYISSQNFDRRAFAAVNAITVVPGAIGAFRKKAIIEVGGFTTDTLAEDCDLTIRLLRNGYKVLNENEALAFTEAPETLKMFIKQRFRWSFGVLQTSWKHRDLLFKKEHQWLGWLAMPNILVFQYIIPSVIPLADLFMLIGLVTGNAGKIITYYLLFMLVDAAVSFMAFRMEKEKMRRLLWIIPQRLIYRWLMWYILFKAVRRAIKGELQNWGVLKRTGNVNIEPARPQPQPAFKILHK